MMRRLWAWLTTKRVCAWCRYPVTAEPTAMFRPVTSRWNMRGYMGGNPLAKHATHGICAKCAEFSRKTAHDLAMGS